MILSFSSIKCYQDLGNQEIDKQMRERSERCSSIASPIIKLKENRLSVLPFIGKGKGRWLFFFVAYVYDYFLVRVFSYSKLLPMCKAEHSIH
jgi:hypothetical protein